MLQLRNRQSTKNNSLNSSKTSLNNSFYAQDSTSFLTKRSGLASKAQYYGVDDKEESFQFLKSYLDCALMDKAYKTRIPIMQGSSLSSKIEAVGSSRPGRTTFYGTLKSLWKRVCVDNALYVYNMAMNRKEGLQSNEKNVEYKKMMKSYEDAFRNMKEADLENKKVLKVAQLQGSEIKTRELVKNENPRLNVSKQDKNKRCKDLSLIFFKFFLGKPDINKSKIGYDDIFINFSDNTSCIECKYYFKLVQKQGVMKKNWKTMKEKF